MIVTVSKESNQHKMVKLEDEYEERIERTL